MKINTPTKNRMRPLKPGVLEVYYAKHPEMGPDVIAQNGGSGASQWDRSFIMGALTSERKHVPMGKTWLDAIWEPSILDELVSRGYDITTLRFSIRQLPPKPCPMLGAHNGDGTQTPGCTCPETKP